MLDQLTAPHSSNPQALLDLIRAGDTSAVGPLLEFYSRYLHLIARVQIGRRLQGKAHPDDVVQETFLEAHRQFPNFRGHTEAELLAWLRRILAGQIALIFRRYLGTKGRDVLLERQLQADVDDSSQAMAAQIPAAVSSPSQRADRREQAALLAEALDRLPHDYREVIILRHLEQLPFAIVASRMNRTEDSVQKLWVRALTTLRRTLGNLA